MVKALVVIDVQRGMFELPLLTSLDDRYGLVVDDILRIGDDFRVCGRPESR